MPEQPRSARKTQNCVIALFTNKARPNCLGYRYLGEWSQRENNRCIEADLLRAKVHRASGLSGASVFGKRWPRSYTGHRHLPLAMMHLGLVGCNEPAVCLVHRRSASVGQGRTLDIVTCRWRRCTLISGELNAPYRN